MVREGHLLADHVHMMMGTRSSPDLVRITEMLEIRPAKP
jgi:hypothetical protein